MGKIKFSASRAGIAAIILWLLSSFVSITPLIAILLLVLVAVVGFWPTRRMQSQGTQGRGAQTLKVVIDNGKITWEWSDYLGVALLIVVIAALVKGVNPLDILKLFPALK